MAKHLVIDRKNIPIPTGPLEYVVPPQFNFKIEVELPKDIEKEALKNPLLLQEWHDMATKIMEQTVDTIAGKCKAFDKGFVVMFAKATDKKFVEAHLKGLNDAIQSDIKVAVKAAELGVKDIWDDLVAKRKEWKGFKIKVGLSIFGTLATLAVSIAAMAASGFTGGASGAVAIIGFVKSGVKLAEDIKKIAHTIETAHGELTFHIKAIGDNYDNAAKKYANEIGQAFIKEFLGLSLPSIKTVGESYDTLKAKYAQVVVKVHDLAKNLQKILDKQEVMEKDFIDEAQKKLAKHPVKDKAGQFKKLKDQFNEAILESTTAVRKALSRIMKLYDELKTWAPKIKEVGEQVAVIKAKDTKALQVLREALKFAALGLAPLDGNNIATKAQDLGLGLGGALGGYVYDKITSKATSGTVFDAK